MFLRSITLVNEDYLQSVSLDNRHPCNGISPASWVIVAIQYKTPDITECRRTTVASVSECRNTSLHPRNTKKVIGMLRIFGGVVLPLYLLESKVVWVIERGAEENSASSHGDSQGFKDQNRGV